ncbi:hypothetical protein Tco_0715013 [Tanacetum coccineum]
MAGVDVDTLTMEQYLALSRENKAPSSASLAYSIFPESLKTHSCSEFFPLLLSEPQKYRWTDSPHELSIPGITLKRPLSKGPIHGMAPAQALTTIQTMTDHSQKWHDGTTSRNIRSSSRNDRLAALVNRLEAQFAKDLTSTRIVPSTRKLNKLKRSDMKNSDKQRPLTGTMK